MVMSVNVFLYLLIFLLLVGFKYPSMLLYPLCYLMESVICYDLSGEVINFHAKLVFMYFLSFEIMLLMVYFLVYRLIILKVVFVSNKIKIYFIAVFFSNFLFEILIYLGLPVYVVFFIVVVVFFTLHSNKFLLSFVNICVFFEYFLYYFYKSKD